MLRRVLNTLKGFVEGVFFDWHNGELLRQLDSFVTMIIKYQLMNPANQLRTIMDKKLVRDKRGDKTPLSKQNSDL